MGKRKLGNEKTNKSENKHNIKQPSRKFSSVHSPDNENNVYSLGETPYHPQMDHHISLLSTIPSPVQRSEFIKQLHRTYGNRYVQRLMDTVNVQAKLSISQPGDSYEQEADRVADDVTRSINSPVQRQDPEEEEELQMQEDDEDLLQGKLGVWRQIPEEEELLQGKRYIQRQFGDEEEEFLQGKPDIQRQFGDEEEELLQGKLDVQRQFGDEEEELLQGKLDIQRQDMATCEACGEEYDMDISGETCPHCGATEPLVPVGHGKHKGPNIEVPDMATCEACGEEYDMNISGETCPHCGATEPLVPVGHRSHKGPNTGIPDMATCETCGKNYDMDKSGETCPYCGATEPLVSLGHKGPSVQGKLDAQRQDLEEEELIQGKFDVNRQSPEEEEELQMKPGGNAESIAADDIETRINSKKGGGQPLTNEVREPMEQAFGTDFSGVRVHTDTEADTLNQELSAKAFTTGQDVFFREGEYSPGSDSGKKLIAHELTHVVQQGGGKSLAKLDQVSLEPQYGVDNTVLHYQANMDQIQRLTVDGVPTVINTLTYTQCVNYLDKIRQNQLVAAAGGNVPYPNIVNNDGDIDALNTQKDAQKQLAAQNELECREGFIESTARADQSIKYGHVDTCMTITCVLDDNRFVGAHEGMFSRVPGGLTALHAQAIAGGHQIDHVYARGAASWAYPVAAGGELTPTVGCPRCQGTGRIKRHWLVRWIPGVSRYITCPDCNNGLVAPAGYISVAANRNGFEQWLQARLGANSAIYQRREGQAISVVPGE